MTLRSHAEHELRAAGYTVNDPAAEEGQNKWMAENVLALIDLFAEQGHSGSSAPYCVRLFTKLASYEPLGPLTGADDEWVEVETGTWQNKRASNVFKESDGRAYQYDGRVFREPDGICYTNHDSRVYIEFPYTPTREYVDVP